MGSGLHWEWRGFGAISAPLRQRIEALPLAFAGSPEGQTFDDRYLWVPGCRINVKLRRGGENGLKFKRLRDADGDFELWEERPDELYALPLGPRVVEKLARELGVRLPAACERHFHDEGTLLDFLGRVVPPAVVVAVKKRRKSYRLELEAAAEQPPATVHVEIAEITAPEPIVSVALEECTHLRPDDPPARSSAASAAVVRAHAALALAEPGLRPLNYLHAIERWAQGEGIA